LAPPPRRTKWTYAQKGTSRRGVLAEIRQLVRRMAKENPTWGYTRIQGALKNVGHRVGRSTIARILRAHGIPPVPERPTSWQTFLRAHARDLERKLADFQAYSNAARSHPSLEGHSPLTCAGGHTMAAADLKSVRWVSHCRDLVRLPVAA
jgi:HTH-like domain